MKRKALSISRSLVLVALAIGALWVWRWRAPGNPGPEARPAAASVRETPAPAAQKQEPAKAGAKPERSQQASASLEGEPVPRKPTLGLGPQRESHPLTPGERERLGPEIEPYQKAWDKHIAPLLYPAGHPLEGSYLGDVRDLL